MVSTSTAIVDLVFCSFAIHENGFLKDTNLYRAGKLAALTWLNPSGLFFRRICWTNGRSTA
jgi:hypothetical protein